jgi:segregation and condensation protein B
MDLLCYYTNMTPDVQIEGLLFYKSVPLKKRAVMETLRLSNESFTDALAVLRERLQCGATRLIETDNEIQLMTAPTIAPLIESIRRDELRGEIGKAGIEVLAIVLYRSPVSRAEIDRIRGVNSSFSIRTLLMRGLIERRAGGEGSHTYTITPALLSHLGVTHRHELPNFSTIMNALESFEATSEPIP